MNRARNSIFVASILTTFGLPQSVHALTFPQAVGLFHIAVGLILTGIMLLFITGFGIYIVRLNTWPSHRDAAIRVLEWPVAMLFMLIVVLSIINAIQHHGEIALPIIAFLVIVLVGFYLVRLFAFSKKKPPPPPPGRR